MSEVRGAIAEAELLKLAHALGVDVDDLDMVASLSGEDLRTLRKQAGEALFQADKQAFARVAALSKAVPGALAAKLTEVALPPMLAARTAELLEPARAADMVNRISERYLADVSAAMDAARAPEVIRAIPPARVAGVGRVLAERKEWVVMGGFVSVVSDDALAASVADLDGEQLLHVGFVLDDLSRLEDIAGMLVEAQLDAVLAAAASAGLWRELTQLVANLSRDRVERLRHRYAAAADEVHARYRAAVEAGDLEASILALLQA